MSKLAKHDLAKEECPECGEQYKAFYKKPKETMLKDSEFEVVTDFVKCVNKKCTKYKVLLPRYKYGISVQIPIEIVNPLPMVKMFNKD